MKPYLDSGDTGTARGSIVSSITLWIRTIELGYSRYCHREKPDILAREQK